ncbi:hypothetical protein LUZ63_011890 [Rhynchospora breviuscula]|uniref:Folate receptor-like domain-containing protein n=1 Tax=Rhynchospora breviuscula TaxID=2022672 RepID=A0A9Q0CJL7_9POAL|nr:hypothetical protein LUZ63_011890 [Rhynchospora breviuscula]
MKSLSLSPPLLVFVFFNLFVPSSSLGERENGLCIYQGGRFPPFSIEGQKPRKAPKGPRDLTLCRVFRHNTCCDITQTYPALVSVRKLASTGEGGRECLHLWELLECSICDPTVGTRSGPPQICASFCNMVFDACSGAYFSLDMKTQILSPCGLNDIVCGKLNKWASNGTELCHLTGFSVHNDSVTSDEGGAVQFCYGGKESLDSIANSWKFSEHGSAFDSQHSSFWGLETVSWAIGGMVLTAGLVYISKRKSYSRRQRQAATIRTATRRR